VTADEFATFIAKQARSFAVNMRRIGVEHAWPADWMKTFLAWSEWETEVHELYWGKPDEPLESD